MSRIEVPGTIEVFAVKHLPIVKSYVEKLGVVELLNDLVASEMDVEPGVMFLGMLLDTLSGRSPLYRFEDFFETQDTDLLLGRPIEAKRFNDDNVGRFLDKLYETGTMKIFTEIAKRAVDRFGLSGRHVHFDTTSVRVFGAPIGGRLSRKRACPMR
jgi:transposase